MKFLSSLKNKNLSGRICLLRVDLNVKDSELNKNNLRVRAVLPTIKFLTEKGARVVILSHRGRPKPAKRADSEFRIQNLEFSLKPLAGILSRLLKKPVNFISLKELSTPKSAKEKISNSIKGSVFLAENLRFLPGEEKNDKKIAKQLASLGDFYVNDAFAVSHRANASVEAITKFLPSYAGLLMKKEIENLGKVMKAAKKPFVIILGGAKISDKLGIIKNFKKNADKFLIGGGVANTFLVAEGLPIGDSIFEEKMIPEAKKLLKLPPSTRSGQAKIILPVDYAMEKGKILDIGPETAKRYAEIIKKAKTIIWNGPMGYFENPKFAQGSKAVTEAILRSKAFAVIGGGETTSLFLNSKSKILNSKIFISTGGGAMLEYLGGKKLPGIEALRR
ncbi:phosphoglycerate kinase [Candidatus Wolfebacteria bacterium]|nr:phosphoglycerate kinase [Candidatus Wolfebacteria bacterium]